MINSLGALHGAAKAKETKTTFPTQVYSLETWLVSDSTSKILHTAISKWSEDRLPIKQKKITCVLKGIKEKEDSSFITRHQVKRCPFCCPASWRVRVKRVNIWPLSAALISV